MPVIFTDNKILFRDGKVAMDLACCCGSGSGSGSDGTGACPLELESGGDLELESGDLIDLEHCGSEGSGSGSGSEGSGSGSGPCCETWFTKFYELADIPDPFPDLITACVVPTIIGYVRGGDSGSGEGIAPHVHYEAYFDDGAIYLSDLHVFSSVVGTRDPTNVLDPTEKPDCAIALARARMSSCDATVLIPGDKREVLGSPDHTGTSYYARDVVLESGDIAGQPVCNFVEPGLIAPGVVLKNYLEFVDREAGVVILRHTCETLPPPPPEGSSGSGSGTDGFCPPLELESGESLLIETGDELETECEEGSGSGSGSGFDPCCGFTISEGGHPDEITATVIDSDRADWIGEFGVMPFDSLLFLGYTGQIDVPCERPGGQTILSISFHLRCRDDGSWIFYEVASEDFVVCEIISCDPFLLRVRFDLSSVPGCTDGGGTWVELEITL